MAMPSLSRRNHVIQEAVRSMYYLDQKIGAFGRLGARASGTAACNAFVWSGLADCGPNGSPEAERPAEVVPEQPVPSAGANIPARQSSNAVNTSVSISKDEGSSEERIF